jgi:hypothetical protein
MAEQQDHGQPASNSGPSKGGMARAEQLTPEERQEIARRAAEARWHGVAVATHGSPDHPLKIGDIEIPCYVLDDDGFDGPDEDRRVITQQGIIEALGMSRGGSTGKSGSRLAKFVSGQSLSPYFPEDFDCGMQPIKFRTPQGSIAHGYSATVMADICEAVLAARAEENLHHNQQHIATRCEILMRGWARVGLVALIDEATGYQRDRARHSLEQILERFISKDLLKWAKRFPDEFYEELFRLRGWQYHPLSVKRPILVGRLTVDVVYERIAPGVLEELKRITPRDIKGRLKHKYHQRLTEDVGHPRLREHLWAVITLMRVFDAWPPFYAALKRALPKQNPCPLFDSFKDKEVDDSEETTD